MLDLGLSQMLFEPVDGHNLSANLSANTHSEAEKLVVPLED
jgi:hypothetical protein